MPKDEGKDEGKQAADLVAKLKLSDKEHSIKDLVCSSRCCCLFVLIVDCDCCDGQVELSAVVEDRQWLPNLRTYAKLDDAGLLGDKVCALFGCACVCCLGWM